jgi:serine/threonine-protein kinase
MKAEIEKLFHELADQSPEARSRYFAEHKVDGPTRQEVEALLAFDSGASTFLLQDVSIAASRALPLLDAKGWRCGPYRLLELVGRGGMGAVYRAERADGEVTLEVAVKLLPPGAADPQRERFLQERQILAALRHPNIARMLDAGHLENGQPFLAMEYVDGKPIDAFAAGFRVRQKIALFLKVCAAVAYLHRNLIVHRDLKPSNILVTADGEPKLLDFGIAKILDLATDTTMTSMRVLTPDYASPEQASGGRISTATDIYSLGAVLYQLLTGKPPHQFDEKSFEVVVLVIATREVTRPSKFAPELKGDLEAILLRALRKDPQERYGTVEQFSDDLEAFLESRPVKARSGNTWYKTTKFLRRYWVPVTAAALVISSLSAGLYVANRQRAIAQRRFGQLRQLAHQVIFDLSQDIAGLPGAINVQHKVLATTTQYLAGLGADAANDRGLALEVAESYMQVARIQGVPSWNNLGRNAEADANLRKAEELVDFVLSAEAGNRNALLLSASVAHDRAAVAYNAGWNEQTVRCGSKARERFDRLVRLGNLTRKEINRATYIYADLAELDLRLHRFGDAARFARLAIEISRTNTMIAGPRTEAFSMLASALKNLGDFPGAIEAISEARYEEAAYRRYAVDSPPDYWPPYGRLILAVVRCHEGLILAGCGGVDLNRPSEAAELFREAFDAVEETAKGEPKDYQARTSLAESGRYLGDTLRQSDPQQALKVYDHALLRIREVPNGLEARRLEASLLANSSYTARWTHHEKDARERIDAAFRLLRETKDYPAESIKPGSEADIAERALADHYAETGQPHKAIETYEELRHRILASNPDPQNDLANAASMSRLDASLGTLLLRVSRTEEAVSLDKSRLELWQQWDRKLPNNPFVQRQIVAAQPQPERAR